MLAKAAAMRPGRFGRRSSAIVMLGLVQVVTVVVAFYLLMDRNGGSDTTILSTAPTTSTTPFATIDGPDAPSTCSAVPTGPLSATLTVCPSSGKAGDVIAMVGGSFVVNSQNVRNSITVLIHWNSAEGPVLAQVQPDKHGNIAVAFAVPTDVPGQYEVVATQRDSNGTDVSGPPRHAGFEVLDGKRGLPPTPATPPGPP